MVKLICKGTVLPSTSRITRLHSAGDCQVLCIGERVFQYLSSSGTGCLHNLSPGQTIATCQRNMSQHCWTQHVACVWPPCCDVLSVVGSNLTMVKFEPTTPNMSQHIATRWPNARNMLRPTLLRYVALACCDRLAGALRRSRSRRSEGFSKSKGRLVESLTKILSLPS